MVITLNVQEEFCKMLDDVAALCGRTRSEHMRAAIEHENQRVLEERMVFLSKTLAQESFDECAADGLHE